MALSQRGKKDAAQFLLAVRHFTSESSAGFATPATRGFVGTGAHMTIRPLLCSNFGRLWVRTEVPKIEDLPFNHRGRCAAGLRNVAVVHLVRGKRPLRPSFSRSLCGRFLGEAASQLNGTP
jgi:hypothetical protein